MSRFQVVEPPTYPEFLRDRGLRPRLGPSASALAARPSSTLMITLEGTVGGVDDPPVLVPLGQPDAVISFKPAIHPKSKPANFLQALQDPVCGSSSAGN